MSVACYQLDANVGPPLEIVGPAGSFYSINGQFNTLLSANNGGAGDCTPPPCEAPNAPADMPAAAAACQDLQATTTTATVAPTTVPTTACAAGDHLRWQCPAARAHRPLPVPEPTRNAAGECVNVLSTGAGQLPFTGSASEDMARFGAIVPPPAPAVSPPAACGLLQAN
ncbi:MAG: hypothetical protein R2749_26000 [Acidimicrobiales bacterium]